MYKDPTEWRNDFKRWKETGESPWEAGRRKNLPKFAYGIEGQSIFLKVNNYIPRAKAKVLQAKTKAIPLKYIGGDPEEARAEFWRQEPVLQHAVDSVAQRYNVDPEVIKYRINHEGFVDHYIQDRNKAIKRGNQNFIPRGYRILNDFVPNGAGVSEFGLDDYGTYLEEGKIQLTGKQLYERPNGFEYMTPQYYVGFSRDGQAYINEKGRQTNPATGWDNATNFGMVAAGLKYFKDKAREDFPNASDKDLNRYSLAYFNRGETGGKKWVKSGAKGYNLPKYELGTEGDTLYVEKDAHKGWKGVKNFLKSALNHTLYNFSSESGGSTNPIHVLAGGANYTGSYIYPSSNYTHNLRTLSDDNGVGLGGSTKYGGKNAVEDRNIVAKQFGRKSNLKKLRDDTYRIGNISFTGPVYEGKIYPMNQDSVYYLPNSVKAEIDSLVNADRSYSVDMNNIRELNRRFPRQVLDNVRNARLKPLKSNNKYSLKATKLWDFSSPNILFGNLYDKLINLSGGNKFVLEQNIPIKFVNKDRTDDWDLIKSTLTQ